MVLVEVGCGLVLLAQSCSLVVAQNRQAVEVHLLLEVLGRCHLQVHHL
jgi:hypothetical protein